MRFVPDLIDAFGGPTAFAAVIGKRASTASEMKRNRSIPPKYWKRIVEVAAQRGIDVNYETLALMHAPEAEQGMARS